MNLASSAATSAGRWIVNPALRRVGIDEDDLPLPEVDESKLRFLDAKPSTETLEAREMEFETNVAMSKREHWDGQERWQGRENEEMRLVNILHPNAVMRKLQRAGVDARIEYSPYARLWLNDFPRLGRLGITAHVADEETGKITTKTITTLMDAGGPEWSIMHFNRYDVPTSEKYRGWRTAMLHLIIANVVTQEEVDRAFGPVVLNAASEFYRLQLQKNRERRMGLSV